MYDVIVVGAGIVGSATAYHLAKWNKNTLLLDQFPLPHSRGSSHGQSRTTRKAYGSKAYYTHMMKEAFEMTSVLEKECGETLFVKTGCLACGPAGDPYIEGTKETLTRHGVPYEKFGILEQRRRYPMASFPDNYEFVLDKSGGILRADKMLNAYHQQFVHHGGVLHDGEQMLDIDPGPVVTVRTTKAEYKARSVVLAPGSWAPKVLTQIGVNVPLKPLRIIVCYWKQKSANDGDTFPPFFSYFPGCRFPIYALPSSEYPGLVKVCLHAGPQIDPDSRDAVDDRWVMDAVKYLVDRHLPTLEKEPKIIEPCIYTVTPDEDFILDVHPIWKNIVIGAGFSGHGFKLAPVVGKILAQLSTGEQPTYDLSPFKMYRFPTTTISDCKKLYTSKL